MSEVVHILLVQGDPEDRHRASAALARAGWEVTEAASGAASLEALDRGGDFVVLLDFDLPDLDGRELLAHLAEHHPDTPAVVVTGVDDLGVAIHAMQQGAWDYVVKRPDRSHLRDLPHVIARALARRELVRERNGYRAEIEALAIALRGTADGVVILDASGRITFVNRALAEALGLPESALVGRLLDGLVQVPEDDGAFDDVLAAVAEHGRWSGQLRTRPGALAEGVWEVSLTPIPAPVRAVVGILRDVRDKHALEQLRADFLSMVTHDIKVPLTVILGYCEMLGDPEPPPGEVPLDIVARIRESGEQIHALVCNFLDLSRIEAGRLTIDPRPFDLRAMLAHVLEQHSTSARRKGIVLALESERTEPLVADEGQLERVVTNLLANAIKYTPNGGRVTVSAGCERDRIVMAVRDTGRGIPAGELPHLFERYRRVRETQRTEGTGLGLFIAKTIVDAHGGDIHVESAPGVGSTFTVIIPAAGPLPALR